MERRPLQYDSPKTYGMKVTCGNCNHKDYVYIDKGRKAVDFLMDEKCPNCGCLTLSLSNHNGFCQGDFKMEPYIQSLA